MTSLTIGSRGSQLALWQANYVAARLHVAGVSTRIEIIRTTGDHLQTASLAQAGGKGLFTKEIEDALLAGTIDLAVHSLKDLPTEMPQGLALAAIPERERALLMPFAAPRWRHFRKARVSGPVRDAAARSCAFCAPICKSIPSAATSIRVCAS